MDIMVAKAMKLAGFFGEKMLHVSLTEYEVMLYEAACRFLEQFFILQRVRVEQAIGETLNGGDIDYSEGSPAS